MGLLLKIIEIILAVLYWCSAGVYTGHFIRSTRLSSGLCSIFIRLTLIWHLVFFALISWNFGRNPVASFYEFLSALALGLLLIYLYLEVRFHNRSLGPWVLTLAAAAQTVSTILAKHPYAEDVSPAILTSWFTFHQIFITLAFSSLLISAIFSLMYLVLYRSLKRKLFDVFFERFLPLATLGEMNYQALLTGVIFLAINIPVAFAMVYAFNNGEWDFQYCMFFTYFIVYALGALLGKFAGWRGNRLAIYSLVSLCILVVATGAAKFFTERHAWF